MNAVQHHESQPRDVQHQEQVNTPTPREACHKVRRHESHHHHANIVVQGMSAAPSIHACEVVHRARHVLNQHRRARLARCTDDWNETLRIIISSNWNEILRISISRRLE